jgi:hypothetical protein
MDDEVGRAAVVRAVLTLPYDEQAAAVGWLLREVRQPSELLTPGLSPEVQRMLAGAATLASSAPDLAGADLTMLPVRLPRDQYTALKTWCAANKFSMATVVRGLVERFLIDQGKRSA